MWLRRIITRGEFYLLCIFWQDILCNLQYLKGMKKQEIYDICTPSTNGKKHDSCCFPPQILTCCNINIDERYWNIDVPMDILEVKWKENFILIFYHFILLTIVLRDVSVYSTDTRTQLYTQYTLQQKYLLLNIEICFGGVISNLFLLF